MPKRLIKKGSFYIDLYKVDIQIYAMSTAKDVCYQVKRLHRKFGFDTIGIEEEADGYALTFPNKNAGTFYVVLGVEGLNVNTIVHEIDHLRNYILQHAGIDEQGDDKESSATLAGYLGEKVFSFLVKNNIKIDFE